MNKHVADFLLLARCLSPGMAADDRAALRDALAAGGVDWMALAGLANRHFVTPALWVSLRDNGLTDVLPDDLGDYLRELHARNTARNARIREQALEIAGALNGVGIVPVLLKGGVHLFADGYGDPGARMMLDLDLLVPEPGFARAVEVLEGLGYHIVGDSEGWVYHYPPLARPGEPATIEIHKRVGEQRRILPVEDAMRDAVPLSADGAGIKALSPTHRVFHNVFHAQVQDRRQALGTVSLQQLLDLHAISAGGAVDWDAVRRTLQRHRLGAALESHVYLAHRLLGLPRPEAVPETRRAARHYRRVLAGMRWPLLLSAVSLWGAMTHPFKRHFIDCIYGSGGNPLLLNIHRGREAWKFMKKYKWRLWGKIREIRDIHYDFE